MTANDSGSGKTTVATEDSFCNFTGSPKDSYGGPCEDGITPFAEDDSYRRRVFNSNFCQIMKYVEDNNLSSFPGKGKKERRLSNWMYRQFKRTDLPQDEEIKLSVLRQHFDDTPRAQKEERRWYQFLHEMKKYKEEYHTFTISKRDFVHKKLYDWAARQRKEARDGRLSPERRQKLVDIGFLVAG